MRSSALGAGLVAQTQGGMPPFRLQRPTSVREAMDVHEQLPGAVFAAGCTDLVAQVREGLQVVDLVSLRRVAGLSAVTFEDGVLQLGSLLTHDRAATDETLRAHVPGLAEAWAAVATVRVRYRATLGGNLMARRPRYELPVLLSSLDATALLSQGQQVRRTPVEDLWSEPSAPSPLLQQVAVDTGSLRWFGYDRSMRPLLTVALSVRAAAEGLRLTAAVGSEYGAPFLLRHTVPEDALGGLAPREVGGEMAADVPDRSGDYAGSAGYRRRVVAALLARHLQTAQERESA